MEAVSPGKNPVGRETFPLLPLREKTGWQIIDAIRGRVPGVPVIDDRVVTTQASARGLVNARSALLPQPFGLDVLKAASVDALYARAPFPLTPGRSPAPSG